MSTPMKIVNVEPERVQAPVDRFTFIDAGGDTVKIDEHSDGHVMMTMVDRCTMWIRRADLNLFIKLMTHIRDKGFVTFKE